MPEQGKAEPQPCPDVRLIPAGSLPNWPNDVVAIRRDENPRLPWHCSNGARLSDDYVGDAQRLIPASALMETARLLGYLLAIYDGAVGIHAQIRMDTEQDQELHERSIATMKQVAEPVREWIASLATEHGIESPELERIVWGQA